MSHAEGSRKEGGGAAPRPHTRSPRTARRVPSPAALARPNTVRHVPSPARDEPRHREPLPHCALCAANAAAAGCPRCPGRCSRPVRKA